MYPELMQTFTLKLNLSWSYIRFSKASGREHFSRATLESIAFQSKDLLKTMEADTGLDTTSLRVDGGATANKFLMQFQSDLLQIQIALPHNHESTVLGAAFLAGLHSKFWTSKDLKKFISNFLRI